MPNFYNHLHMEINLNIIYMATDYSMYMARKLSEAHRSFMFWRKNKTKTTVCRCEQSQKGMGGGGFDLAGKQILTETGSCPLTKIGPRQNTAADKSIQLQSPFLCVCVFLSPLDSFKCIFKGKSQTAQVSFSGTPLSHDSVLTQEILTTGFTSHHGDIGYSIFRQSRANLCIY